MKGYCGFICRYPDVQSVAVQFPPTCAMSVILGFSSPSPSEFHEATRMRKTVQGEVTACLAQPRTRGQKNEARVQRSAYQTPKLS